MWSVLSYNVNVRGDSMEKQEILIDSIKQNLQDAGCDEELITTFLKHYQDNNSHELIKSLSCHRCNLLKQLHIEQNKIDCLDYLIYTIKKSKEKEEEYEKHFNYIK